MDDRWSVNGWVGEWVEGWIGEWMDDNWKNRWVGEKADGETMQST